MLKNLKRWLGLERKAPRIPPVAATGPRRPTARPKNGAAKAGANGKANANGKTSTNGKANAVVKGTRPSAPKPNSKKPRRPVDVLDNPRLSLERPDEGFDPYNTGAFNRSQSWERIGKKKR